MLKWLEGKRSYIIGTIVILGAVLILVTNLNFSDIPDFVWMILSGLGFAAIRAAIDSVSKNDNKGWKSYLAAVAIAVLGILKMIGIEYPVEILAAFEGLGIVGIRDALSKIPK